MQYFLCKALSTLHEVHITLVTFLLNESRKQIFLRVTALEMSCLYWICLRGVKLDKATSRYFFFHVKILSLTSASFKTQVDFWADASLSLGLAFSSTLFRIMARVANTIHWKYRQNVAHYFRLDEGLGNLVPRAFPLNSRKRKFPRNELRLLVTFAQRAWQPTKPNWPIIDCVTRASIVRQRITL